MKYGPKAQLLASIQGFTNTQLQMVNTQIYPNRLSKEKFEQHTEKGLDHAIYLVRSIKAKQEAARNNMIQGLDADAPKRTNVMFVYGHPPATPLTLSETAVDFAKSMLKGMFSF